MSSSDDAVRLQALLDVARVVGEARHLDDLIERAAEQARRALDAASSSISRWDPQSGVLRTLVNVGLLGPGETRFPTEETFSLATYPEMTALVEQRRSVLAVAEDRTTEGEILRSLQKDSSLSVPVIVDTRVWGELWVSRSAGQPRYLWSDLAFAEAVATQIAAGIVQADHLARVERLAFADPLTGLANRRAVDERLDAVLADPAGAAGPVSIVLADINRLKQVNDTFGHEAGDRLIVAVAEAVSRASGLAQDALAARIGGDEFAVVVIGEPMQVAVTVADELCRLVDTQPMSTGISCGVASTEVLPGPVEDAVRLFRLADAAQYRAKRSGLRHPVVAGRTATLEAAEAGDNPADRRLRRGRLSTDVPAALESGLAMLDGLAAAGTQARLEAVADHMRDLLDAASWWVSAVPADSEDLATLSTSVQRAAEPGAPSARLDVQAVFDLSEYPVTRNAIELAGSFYVEVGMPGNDPAEEEALAVTGYRSVLGAGAADAAAGWLVEVYADSISLPMGGFESVLRALVAVAVSGAGRPGRDVTVPAAWGAAEPVGEAEPSKA